MDLLLQSHATRDTAMKTALTKVNQQFSSEISDLSSKRSGLHFNATNMTEERLRNFEITDLASQMQSQAPTFWTTMDSLLSANPKINRHREQARERAIQKGTQRKPRVPGGEGEIDMSDVPVPDDTDGDLADTTMDYMDEIGQESVRSGIEISDAIRHVEEKYEKQRLIVRHMLLLLINLLSSNYWNHQRKVIAISMMLQTTNQRCNAFQSIMGIFLHSCNCPETVRELFSRLGLSVSSSTINRGINNLSAEAEKAMVVLMQTLLALLAYDNVDLELKHSVPTVETPSSTSVHLTSGTFIPLRNVALNDLNCADQLWEKSLNNPANAHKTTSLKAEPPQIPIDDLLNIFAMTDVPDSNGLVQADRFNCWKFLQDLTQHGPKYFHQFRTRVGQPEEIDCLPVEKTTQVPCRILKIHPATAAENAEAIEKFLKQGGVGDPSKQGQNGLKSPDNHVVLFFGDLLTGDRIRGLLQSRGEEDTPFNRLNCVVYVMGLFHLKMAAADALWRIFIRPKKHNKTDMDDNSLMSYVTELRPKETGKVESNPGFRRMHEIIQHAGIVSRLDCWRLAAECDTLDDFAAKKPSWDKLQKMAWELVEKHVSKSNDISMERNKPSAERDFQYENSLLRHQYFLLYEELSHAMNYGDIGRLEQCMLSWMFIFQGCGKHKYSAELRRYLENMYFIYPDGLRYVQADIQTPIGAVY